MTVFSMAVKRLQLCNNETIHLNTEDKNTTKTKYYF